MRAFYSRAARVGVVVAAMLMLGCNTTLRNKQLENVAKDWSLVVRASQVIPVYPLTEDLQPGDVLLVSTSVDKQADAYQEKGFLPLDVLYVRLPLVKEFHDFYGLRYGVDGSNAPPSRWQTPDADGKLHWELAPHAAFPTYRFEVSSGAGASLAIPIQGVPAALGFMKTGKASGTVTFSDAYTYGLDTARLERSLRAWSLGERARLSELGPVEDKYHYLRVVTRVYVIGKVNVSISNDESAGGSAAAGAPQTINLPEIKDKETAANYESTMKAVNETLGAQTGGKATFAHASSRGVSFSERLSRPLVIGYVGFDVPILKGGRLGAPVSTLARLSGDAPQAITGGNQGTFWLAAVAHMYRALQEIDVQETREIRARLDALQGMAPEKYPFSPYMESGPGQVDRTDGLAAGSGVPGTGFKKLVDYLGNAKTTEEAINGLPPASISQTLAEQRRIAVEEQRRIAGLLASSPAFVEAVDFVFLGTR